MGSEVEGTRQTTKEMVGKLRTFGVAWIEVINLAYYHQLPLLRSLEYHNINAPSSNPRSPLKAVSLPPHLAHFLGWGRSKDT